MVLHMIWENEEEKEEKAEKEEKTMDKNTVEMRWWGTQK